MKIKYIDIPQINYFFSTDLECSKIYASNSFYGFRSNIRKKVDEIFTSSSFLLSFQISFYIFYLEDIQ